MKISNVCGLLAEDLLLESLTCSLQMAPSLTGAGRASAPCHIATASGDKVSPPFNKIRISDRQGALSVCRIYWSDEKEKPKWNCCVFLKEYRYTPES